MFRFPRAGVFHVSIPLMMITLYFHRLQCHPYFLSLALKGVGTGLSSCSGVISTCLSPPPTVSKKELLETIPPLKPYPTLLGLHPSVSLPSNWLPELEAILEFSFFTPYTQSQLSTQSSFTSCTFPKISKNPFMILCLSVTTLF